jgi:DNA-binding response OmpR family regulator
VLFEADGEVLGREQLCQRLGHGKQLDDTRRLDSLISRLRSKVEQQSGVALPLQTFRNLGYAFSGAVEPERRSPLKPAAAGRPEAARL